MVPSKPHGNYRDFSHQVRENQENHHHRSFQNLNLFHPFLDHPSSQDHIYQLQNEYHLWFQHQDQNLHRHQHLQNPRDWDFVVLFRITNVKFKLLSAQCYFSGNRNVRKFPHNVRISTHKVLSNRMVIETFGYFCATFCKRHLTKFLLLIPIFVNF